VPIDHGYAQRAVCRILPRRPVHALVQDWHSLDRHEDIRVRLADHAANTTWPLFARPKISGRTLSRDSCVSGGWRWRADNGL